VDGDNVKPKYTVLRSGLTLVVSFQSYCVISQKRAERMSILRLMIAEI